MFGLFRRKPAPPPYSPDNPGRGSVLELQGLGRWDLLELLAAGLSAQKVEVRRRKGWLELGDGLTLRPQVVEVRDQRPGSWGTSTTLEFHHPVHAPRGSFEFQHAVAPTLEGSFVQGFDGWAQVDLPVLLDMSRPKPEHCLEMRMAFPARARRVLMGPVSRFGEEGWADDDAHEAWCPCCLFSQVMEALRPQLEAADFLGVRLFASRNGDGTFAADCRINGLPWAAGEALLQAYAASWPGQGLEFRKQYVVIQTL